jgi:hypothetical protein
MRKERKKSRAVPLPNDAQPKKLGRSARRRATFASEASNRVGERRKPRSGSIDIEDLSRLGAGSNSGEIGIFRRLIFGLPLALDAPLFLFLLLLFSRAFSNSFFQLSSSLTDFG